MTDNFKLIVVLGCAGGDYVMLLDWGCWYQTHESSQLCRTAVLPRWSLGLILFVNLLMLGFRVFVLQ